VKRVRINAKNVGQAAPEAGAEESSG
jgi:hypothetical protein